MADHKETDVERVKRLTRWQRLGLATIFLGGVLIVGFGVFVWSGIYNISARTDHWSPTDWIIVQLRNRSIATRASDVEVPDLTQPGMVELGAEHYRTACATCHGLPTRERNPVYANMLPEPPDLWETGEDYATEELHWIVYHGLKYTGMPAWPGERRTDEVWPMVALIEYLRANDHESRAALFEESDQAASGCARCHGGESAAPVSAYVPSLNGQSAAYLMRSLREYRAGTRESGMMEPLAHSMTDGQIETVARQFADRDPVAFPAAEPEGDLERGQHLAREGMRNEGIPACDSCHGGANPNFPTLAGQPAQYLTMQLELFARGGRSETGFGAIMTTVAERLSPEDIDAVSAYYAGRQGGESEGADE